MNTREINRALAGMRPRGQRREMLRLMWPFYAYGACMFGLVVVTAWLVMGGAR